KLLREAAEHLEECLETAGAASEREQVADHLGVVDHGVSRIDCSATPRGTTGRSASMIDRNRSACSRAAAPRSRRLALLPAAIPSRVKSSRSFASSSIDENPIHSRRSSSSSLAARSSSGEYT